MLARLLILAALTWLATDAYAQGPAAPPDQAPTLPGVLVEETRQPGAYAAPSASTATKTDTPIMQVPAGIQVVPRQVLEDQQILRVEDVWRDVSSVQPDWGYGSLYDSFIVRGFSSDGVFRDGTRVGLAVSDPANAERIEVLKGPASVLFGRIEPGGFVNVVVKRPEFTPHYSLQQQAGSYDVFRTTTDLTGPILRDSLAYRLVGTYLNAGSFRDFVTTESVFVGPGLRWRPTSRTEVIAAFEYKDEQLVDDYGIPAVGTRPARVPISRFLGEPTDHVNQTTYLGDLTWSHSFGDGWKIRNGVVINATRSTLQDTVPQSLQADDVTMDRGVWIANTDNDERTVFLEITKRFTPTEWLEHTVLVGGDYYAHDAKTAAFTNGFAPVDTINIVNPIYRTLDVSSLKRQAKDFFIKVSDRWYGLYVQNQITIAKIVHLLLGVRHDWASATSGTSTTSYDDVPSDTVRDRAFSPRFGLLVQPWPVLSVYGNYVEGLGRTNGRAADGSPFKPEDAKQYEAGMKVSLWKGALTGTLAFYQITKHNVLTSDVSTPDPFDSVAIGETRSRGIEIDIAGRLTRDLEILLTFAYTDARLTRDSNGNQGNRVANVPRNSGSLWARYRVTNALTLGGGLVGVGSKPGDNENTFVLPSYVTVDAFAAYAWKIGGARLTAQLNANNIFDKTYYKVTNTVDGVPRSNILPGAPFTVIGALRIEY
jgi:iron complex outermembrane receptor protein